MRVHAGWLDLGRYDKVWELKGEAETTTPSPPSNRLLFASSTGRGVHEASDGRRS